MFKNSIFNKYRSRCILDSEDIIKGCILPDIDETDDGYVHHFYNPVTTLNYKGGVDSALERFKLHLNNFKNNKDFISLGRALHYCEDICTPVHVYYEDSFDSFYNLHIHVDFELEIDNFIKEFKDIFLPKDKIAETANLIQYTSDLRRVVYYHSLLSSQLFMALKTDSKGMWKQYAQNTIEHTVNCVSKILFSVFEDILKITELKQKQKELIDYENKGNVG